MGGLYFTAWNPSDDHGARLWRTDGTARGTRVVVDGSDISAIWNLTAVDNTLYFCAGDLDRKAWLWRTTGGGPKAMVVRKFNSDAPSGELAAVGRTIFFSAADGVHGEELWRIKG